MTTPLSRRRFLAGAASAAVAGTLSRGLMGPRPALAAAGALRFGVQARPEHTTWDAMERVWREADELGLDSAFTFDHLMPIDGKAGPCFEGWTGLAALAAKTERIKVGVLVTGNTYRNPALLAKMASTVDHLSHGRLILGLGAAWFQREHEAYGFDFYTPGGRARRLVEAVHVIKLLFSQERSTFAGKYYKLEDAPFDPKPVQRPHPPILIGGMGPKVIQPLVAREADIWHIFVRSGGADEAKRVDTRYHAICREVGRDPAAIELSTSLRPADFAGSPQDTRAKVQALVDAGVRHFILSMSPPYDLGMLRTYAKEVVPAFRT
jgi:F420-dependent oxidoreductase-like protein